MTLNVGTALDKDTTLYTSVNDMCIKHSIKSLDKGMTLGEGTTLRTNENTTCSNHWLSIIRQRDGTGQCGTGQYDTTLTKHHGTG